MSHRSHTVTSVVLLFATVILPLAGCSRESGPATSAASCNNAPSGFCVEYTGSDYRAMKTQRICEAQKGEFLAGPCPTEGQVGSCIVQKGKNSEAFYRYYSGFPGLGVKPTGGAAAAGESQCTMLKGEWIAN